MVVWCQECGNVLVNQHTKRYRDGKIATIPSKSCIVCLGYTDPIMKEFNPSADFEGLMGGNSICACSTIKENKFTCPKCLISELLPIKDIYQCPRCGFVVIDKLQSKSDYFICNANV